jgi:antitoxin VapB
MDTAKLFRNGRSQAVRLPKKYSFEGDEVFVKRLNGIVLLIPKEVDPWQPFVDSLGKFTDDFFNFDRSQGSSETREVIK